MSRELIIIGGGEHATVVGEAAHGGQTSWSVVAVVDPGPSAAADLLGIARVGSDNAFLAQLERTPVHDRPGLVLGLGDLAARRSLLDRYDRSAVEWATVVHPTAWVSPSAHLGHGVVVLAMAVVNAGATIGDHAIINTGAVVEHDVRVGMLAHIGPGAVVGGGARVGDRTLVGLGARVRDHVSVGNDCLVGMGAAVVAPVDDGQVVIGVPARPYKATTG